MINDYKWNEELARQYLKNFEELQFIKKFVRGTEVWDELAANQLRALWTAFCLRGGLTVDTMVYEKSILDIWHVIFLVSDRDGIKPYWFTFDGFKLFMDKLLK